MVFVATLGRLRAPLLRAHRPAVSASRPNANALLPRASTSLGRTPLPGELLVTTADVAELLLAGAIAAAVHAVRDESRSAKLGVGYVHFVTSPKHVHAGYYHTLFTSTLLHHELTGTDASIGVVLLLGRRLALRLGGANYLRVYTASGAVSSFVAVQDLNRRGKLRPITGGMAAANATAAMSLVLFPRAKAALGMPVWFVASAFLAPDYLRVFDSRIDPSQRLSNMTGTVCGGVYGLHLRSTLRMVR